MKKIQFYTVNAIEEVKEFDGVDIMVPSFAILIALKRAQDGILYGCELDDNIFDIVKEEYGIKELQK